MRYFLSPLKGAKSYAWAAFWCFLATVLTYLFWEPVFNRAPFMLFFAAVAITASRSGALRGMLVAFVGVFAVLSRDPADINRMLVPSISMLFNAGIIVFLGTAVRQGIENRRDDQIFRESIGEAVADFLWSCESDGDPLYVNTRMENYVGLTLQEMKNEGWKAFVHPEDMQDLTPHFAEIRLSGRKFSWPVRCRNKEGEYRWFQCRAVSIKDDKGHIIRWVGTSTDIHVQYLAEQEKEKSLKGEKEARIEAESASRMKDEFLAMISHELRTPLNAIFGWLYLLKDPKTTHSETEEGLEIIDHNVHALGQLVNDLLDMSAMITGKTRLNLQEVEFAELLGLAVESALPAAAAKGVSMKHMIEPEYYRLNGDPARLQQVIGNLLSNAIKFTPAGGKIEVVLKRSNSSMQLSVADSGEGIDPVFLQHVFERFRQADATVTRIHGGLGLGLAITRQLVEMHQGTITAESSGVGQGATFRVFLPLLKAEQTLLETGNHFAAKNSELKKGVTSRLTAAKILIIDDDEDTRLVLQQILVSQQAEVSTVPSVDAGLEMLNDSNSSFAAVICDLAMPGASGYDFISRLRALSDKQKSNIPVLALTAFARNEDRVRALEAGFNLHISKPVEPKEIIATVETLLSS